MASVSLDDARCHIVEANGLRLRCWQLGEAGPPVVLLHGFTSTAWRTWKDVAPALAGDYRTYWFDLRGHGESDKPPTGYDLSDYAADARGLCVALGLERPILAGHSLGGATILRMAGETPNFARALIPIDPVLWDKGGRPVRRTRFFDTLDLKRLSPGRLAAMMREQNPGMSEEELVVLLISRAQVSFSAVVETARALSGVDMLAPLEGQVTRARDLISPVAGVACPILLVLGSQTSGVPIPAIVDQEVAGRALAAFQQGRSVAIDAGHNIPQERPAPLAQAMREFLAEVAPTA